MYGREIETDTQRERNHTACACEWISINIGSLFECQFALFSIGHLQCYDNIEK